MAKKRKLATARGMSSDRASATGLPVSMLSARTKSLESRLQRVGDAQQDPRALGGGRRRPARECRLAAGDRELDVGRLGGGDQGVDGPGRRIDVVEVCAVERLGDRPSMWLARIVVSAGLREGLGEPPGIVERVVHRTGATRMMSGSRKSATIPAASRRSSRARAFGSRRLSWAPWPAGSRGVTISTAADGSMRPARYGVSRSDFARRARHARPRRRWPATRATGARARIGGLDIRQPSAPAAGRRSRPSGSASRARCRTSRTGAARSDPSRADG